jgi:hypothetical protein
VDRAEVDQPSLGIVLGASLFWSTIYTWSKFSCALCRLTPCFRSTARLFSRSDLKRIGEYSCYTSNNM